MPEDTPGICVQGNCPGGDSGDGSGSGGGGNFGGGGDEGNNNTRIEERGRNYLRAKSIREIASLNIMRPWNHRYRGNREAFKFNLILQRLLATSAICFNTLKDRDVPLRNREIVVGPTDAEVALFYHIREQIRFREYMMLRDSNTRWFV